MHVGRGQWILSPAFDLNPTPDKAREFKIWLTESAGPEATISGALSTLKPFGIALERGLEILREVESAVATWRTTACSPAIGMTATQAALFNDAFEHSERKEAQKLLGKGQHSRRKSR